MHIIDEIKERLTKPYIIDPKSKAVLERRQRVFEAIEQFEEAQLGSFIIRQLMEDTQ